MKTKTKTKPNNDKFETKGKYYTVESNRKCIEVQAENNSIDFFAEVLGGVIEAFDAERSIMVQAFVPTNAPVKVLKCKIDNNSCSPSQGKVIFEIPLNELLQKGSVQITDAALTTSILLKAENLYGTLVRVTFNY